MSTPITENYWTSILRDGPWSKILPWLAFFIRCMIGLSVLNFGLMILINTGQNANPPGSDLGTVVVWILLQAVPYLSIAIGLGLVFGIYTTLNALLACALALVLPLIILVGLIGQAAVANGGGPRGNPFGMFGPDFGLGMMFASYAVVLVPCLVALVLLSPMQINRYSLDTLMFSKPKRFETSGSTQTSPEFTGKPLDLEKPQDLSTD